VGNRGFSAFGIAIGLLFLIAIQVTFVGGCFGSSVSISQTRDLVPPRIGVIQASNLTVFLVSPANGSYQKSGTPVVLRATGVYENYTLFYSWNGQSNESLALKKDQTTQSNITVPSAALKELE
jgi:hypothetical protein